MQYYSKKQSTVETSILGADFMAIYKSIDALSDLSYKLRMIHSTMSASSYIYGENTFVVHNTSRPESMLKKMSNPMCDHTVHESL